MVDIGSIPDPTTGPFMDMWMNDFLAQSIDWFKGKMTGESHISWENLWFPEFPVDFPLSQPIDP